MIRQNVLILSVEEARFHLCQWYTNTIINDRQNVMDQLLNGTFHDFVPNIKNMQAPMISKMFGDMNLAEIMNLHLGVDQVLIEIRPEFYEMVWDKRNVEPFSCLMCGSHTGCMCYYSPSRE